MTEFIWRGPDETPLLLNEPIIIWTKNNKIQTSSDTKGQLMGPIVNGKRAYTYFSNWDHLRHKYGAKAWAYQKDLMKTW